MLPLFIAKKTAASFSQFRPVVNALMNYRLGKNRGG